MNPRQFLCVMLAILVSGCASWHKPSTVYRARTSTIRQVGYRPTVDRKPLEEHGVGVVFVNEEIDADDASFPGSSGTITPPIEGKAHRSKSRPFRTASQQAEEKWMRDRMPYNPPPEEGYLELPAPSEQRPTGDSRLGRLNK